MEQHRLLVQDFEQAARSLSSTRQLMQLISDRLHHELVRYNWVGFYLVDEQDPRSLLLGPYSGTFTPHVSISFDKGLCGAAASSGTTLVVNDVTTDPRYLEGSEHTKSEIIVPFSVRGSVAGVFDINSYFEGTWTPAECRFVESCAAIVARAM
jgi:L-methionine (R)-S-oxide reductase